MLDGRTILLLAWYESLSEEDKGALVRFLSSQKDKTDIQKKIDNSTNELSTLIRKENKFWKHTWSNVVGNYIADGSIYLLTKLFRIK